MINRVSSVRVGGSVQAGDRVQIRNAAQYHFYGSPGPIHQISKQDNKIYGISYDNFDSRGIFWPKLLSSCYWWLAYIIYQFFFLLLPWPPPVLPPAPPWKSSTLANTSFKPACTAACILWVPRLYLCCGGLQRIFSFMSVPMTRSTRTFWGGAEGAL